MVTRSDEETGRYRGQLQALKQYGATHDIPKVSAGSTLILCGSIFGTTVRQQC
jgi:hypothetical protein